MKKLDVTQFPDIFSTKGIVENPVLNVSFKDILYAKINQSEKYLI